MRLAPNSRRSARPVRFQRHLTQGEFDRLNEIADRGIPYWHPADAIDMGREMLQHGLQKRGKMGVSDFFFKRQTWALSRLWHEFGKCERQIATGHFDIKGDYVRDFLPQPLRGDQGVGRGRHDLYKRV